MLSIKQQTKFPIAQNAQPKPYSPLQKSTLWADIDSHNYHGTSLTEVESVQ
jgi:hypothetical protein